MAYNQRVVWIRTVALSVGLLAVPALASRAPSWRSVEACSGTAGLFQERPEVVCLLADSARRQVYSPIVSCPAHQVG
jgi:hypothetical protein